LDFERNAGEYQPIKRSDCFSYAHDYDFDDWQAEDLWYYVARMDRAYLKYRKATAPTPPSEKRVRKPKHGRNPR
jgi:predicted phosphoadenosine phosphosulfate sulfurtransferase